MEENYRKRIASLNPAQKEAVETIEGPVMVIAGPGTGKTQILTLRIAAILNKTQIDPQNILALTFSESGAMEMRKRLSEIIGTDAFRVEIATFHSFCNDILKNYPESFPNLLSFESITEVEQIELVEKIIETIPLIVLRPFGKPLHYVKDIKNSINDLKKEGVTAVQLEEGLRKQEQDFEKIDDLYHDKGKYKGEMKGKYQTIQKQMEKTKEFISVYKTYETALIEEKKYDFNDMLLGVVKELAKNTSLLLQIQEKYQYILVDEHQDTNATQNQLLELLSDFHEVPNLFVVGDEKQAIYRFQGASLENFLYFQKLYPGAKLIYLDQNYRSQQHILDASSEMIGNNVSAHILPVKNKLKANVSHPLETIKVVAVPHFFDEYTYIAADIEKKKALGTPLDQIAILGRRNSDLMEMAHALQRKKILFAQDADSDIFSDIQMQKLLLLFEALHDLGNDIFLGKMLHIDFLHIEPLDVYKLIQLSKTTKQTLYDVLQNHPELSLQSEEKIQNLIKMLSVWKIASMNKPLDDFFIQVIDESGFQAYMLSLPTRYQTLEKLTGLFGEIKLRVAKNHIYGLKDLLALVATLKKHNVSLKATTQHTKQEGVQLLTVHKSKGLEFDFVYILNCFDGRWGSIRKKGSGITIPWDYLGEQRKVAVEFADIEDERRLFYVGLTRARKEVILTYATQGIEGKEQMPSQFIEELQQDVIQHIDTISLQEYFLKERETLFSVAVDTTIENKEKAYLRNLFLEKGLSATSLDNFLICPWRFFYRNLIALPDVRSLSLIFGSAVHSALDFYVKHKNENDFNEKKVLAVFHAYLEKEHIAASEKTILTAKGEKAILGYLKEIAPLWTEKLQSEMTIRGVKLKDDLFINGKLDLVEYVDEKHVRVHDFKTGKPKRRSQIDETNEKSEYHYLRQLLFYKLLIENYPPGKVLMTEGVIDFVEPDEKGIYHSESFSIIKEQVEQLKELIHDVGNQIVTCSFWNKTCDKKDCEYCLLRSYMH